MTTRLDIETPSGSYPVLVGQGLLREAGRLIAAAHPACPAALVADSQVAALYAPTVLASLQEAGFSPRLFTFPAGEASKNLQTLGQLLEFLAEIPLTRQDLVVALGGGVTGDLAGFAAAVYLRGIAWVQLPTTLLAAVDSSVGGKTAVDLAAGKNLAGAFWQPQLVVCDCGTFSTLAPQVFLNGVAESIKYGAIADRALFDGIADGSLLAQLPQLVSRCVAHKARLVAADERDRGDRQLLNFGHTVGHAIEQCSGYAVSHGQAVSIGMAVVARGAERLGWCRPGTAGAVVSALRQRGLPTGTGYPPAALYEAALRDKKRRGEEIDLVIPRQVGQCIRRRVALPALLQLIQAGCPPWEEEEGC